MKKLLVFVLVSILIVLAVLFFLAINGYRLLNDSLELVDSVKLNMDCQMRLNRIGSLIDKYRSEHNGNYPEDINIFAEITCPLSLEDGSLAAYVYRCGDVNFQTSANFIIAYDSTAIHFGARNVLFSNQMKQYQVNDNTVTYEEFENACMKILSEYSNNIEINLYKNEKFVETIKISALEYDSMSVLKNKIIDYIHDRSTIKTVTFIIHSEEDGSSESIASSNLVRVKLLSEDEFMKAIRQDNILRNELGLLEKPIE